ncbi:tryptophan--tRNA ligase, partial [Staphylococcus capitis]
YKQNVLKRAKALLSKKGMGRLPGIDGKAKMSKSLNNAIYLSDSPDIIKQKVMSMYTDPNHIRVTDPGRVEGNTVFTYLDAFCKDKKNLAEMKEHYKAGGLGDVKVKKYLNEIIQAELEPIRNRRNQYQNNMDYIYEILKDVSNQTRNIVSQTL